MQSEQARERLIEAQRLISEGALDDGAQILKALVAQEPGDLDALFELGLLYKQWELFEEANNTLHRVLERDIARADASLEVAELNYHMGNHTAASLALSRALEGELSQSLEARALDLRAALSKVAAELLLIGVSQVEAGFAHDSAVREIGRSAGVLMGVKVERCELFVEEEEQRFRLYVGREVYLARVDEAEFVVQDEAAEEVARFSLVTEEETRGGGEAELNFELSDQGLSCFVRFLTAVSRLMGRPDALYYVTHGSGLGEWDDPVSFSLDRWDQVLPELAKSKDGWQIDYFLSREEYEIEGHANPALQIKVFISGDPRLVDRLTSLKECPS